MPPNNNGSNGECFENQPIMTETSNKPGNLFLEEGTQTEESGASSMTSSTTPNFSDLENGITPMEDSSETESVIERLSRLFSTAKRDRGTQTAKDPVACETEKLTFDIVYFNLGKRSASPSDDEVVKCLRNCVQLIMEKHSYTLNGMMSRVHLDERTDLQSGFAELSDEIFGSGTQVSWSRIVTFFAFGARLAQYCVEHQMNELVIDVVAIMSSLAVDRLTPFVRDHGGWATLCEAYPLRHNYEDTIWKSLVWTGIGLTAIATLLTLQRSTT